MPAVEPAPIILANLEAEPRLAVQPASCGWAELVPRSWEYRDVASPCWIVYYSSARGASITVAGRAMPIPPRQAFMIPPNVHFDTRCVAPLRMLYLYLDVLGPPAGGGAWAFPRPFPLRAGVLERVFARLLAAPGTAFGSAVQCEVIAAITTGLARRLARLPAITAEREAARTKQLGPVLPALRHIEAHPASPTSNPELARLCGLGTDHFVRRFRDCVGATPAQHIRALRARLAAHRLVFTDWSIERIAAESGFGGRAYLTRVFRQVMGATPAAYRRRRRSGL